MKTLHTIAVLALAIALVAPARGAAESGGPPYGWDLAEDVEWLGLPVERVHVGGWFDASFRDSDLDAEGSNLSVNHLNGFLDVRLAESWQVFVESEIEYRPEIEGLERESEFELEQAYLNHTFSEAFEVRVGRFSTPFGYWTPVHWAIATDTVFAPLHESRRLVPEQQVGARLHGKLFPQIEARELQLDYSLFGGYASEGLEHERSRGPTLGADVRLSDDRLGFAGLSFHRQKGEVGGSPSRIRETTGTFYTQLDGPWNLTFRGEYAIQRNGDDPAISRYRHLGYGKVRWDFWRMHANYRFERADDEVFGPDAVQQIHRFTLGYSPTPRVRLRAEVAEHRLRHSAVSDFRSWALWLGVFF